MTDDAVFWVLAAAYVPAWFRGPDWLVAVLAAGLITNWVSVLVSVSPLADALVLVATFVGALAVMTFIDTRRGYSTVLNPRGRP